MKLDASDFSKSQDFNMTDSKQKVKHDLIWCYSLNFGMKIGMCLFNFMFPDVKQLSWKCFWAYIIC